MSSQHIKFLQQAATENKFWTTLHPWEEDLASWIGAGRDGQNVTKQDRHSYKAEQLMSDNVLANIHAATAEIGACQILGAYCYAGIWDVRDHNKFSGLPDGKWSEIELEIKWRRSSYSMPVDKKDAELNRMVLWVESKLAVRYNCTCNYCEGKVRNTATTVRILGGGFAGDLWLLGTPYNNDPKRMAVSAESLTPILEIVNRWGTRTRT